MSGHYEKVKNYLIDLNLKIIEENEAQELVVVNDEESGIIKL